MFERDYWQRALSITGGRRDLAARLAGVNRTAMFGKLRKLGFPRLRLARTDRFAELGL